MSNKKVAALLAILAGFVVLLVLPARGYVLLPDLCNGLEMTTMGCPSQFGTELNWGWAMEALVTQDTNQIQYWLSRIDMLVGVGIALVAGASVYVLLIGQKRSVLLPLVAAMAVCILLVAVLPAREQIVTEIPKGVCSMEPGSPPCEIERIQDDFIVWGWPSKVTDGAYEQSGRSVGFGALNTFDMVLGAAAAIGLSAGTYLVLARKVVEHGS